MQELADAPVVESASPPAVAPRPHSEWRIVWAAVSRERYWILLAAALGIGLGVAHATIFTGWMD